MQNRGGQPRSGTGSDPIAQLDAAMNETFTELAEQGSGIAPSDVVADRPQRRPARRPQREIAPEQDDQDDSWLEQPGQEREQPARRQAPRRRAPKREAADVILDEADQDTDDGDAAPRRDGSPARGRDGRFLPRGDADEDDDDDAIASDEDEDDDDDEAPSTGRRRRAAEEDEDDEGDLEPEGARRAADDDEDEDDDEREERRPKRRRFPKDIRQEIDRRVEARVGKVIEERDKLREAEHGRRATEGQALDFLIKAIGTQQQRDELQQTVNNTRLPLEQRNRAAAVLQRYISNERYVQTYRLALDAASRQEVAKKDGEMVSGLAKYGIRLDPTIVGQGDRHQTIIHAVRVAVLAERRRNQRELERLQRRDETRRGSRAEQAVAGGRFGRPSLASANGRRANGRVAQVDRLRNAMGYDRGLGTDTRVAMPTERVLQALKDGEIHLADLGLDA